VKKLKVNPVGLLHSGQMVTEWFTHLLTSPVGAGGVGYVPVTLPDPEIEVEMDHDGEEDVETCPRVWTASPRTTMKATRRLNRIM